MNLSCIIHFDSPGTLLRRELETEVCGSEQRLGREGSSFDPCLAFPLLKVSMKRKGQMRTAEHD